MRSVIGLIGAKGAGKTTAFKAISSAFPGVVEITLAGKLKDTCAEVFNIPRDHFDSHEFKEKDLDTPAYMSLETVVSCLRSFYPENEYHLDFNLYVRPHMGKVLYTPRQVAQYVGTEVLRAMNPDIHCLAATRGVEGNIFVVTDMRFPNELDFFKKDPETVFNAIYVKNTSAEVMAGKDPHPSERYLFDLARQAHPIPNESSINEFEHNVISFVSTILK